MWAKGYENLRALGLYSLALLFGNALGHGADAFDLGF
jgi:hypothetical protein